MALPPALVEFGAFLGIVAASVQVYRALFARPKLELADPVIRFFADEDVAEGATSAVEVSFEVSVTVHNVGVRAADEVAIHLQQVSGDFQAFETTHAQFPRTILGGNRETFAARGKFILSGPDYPLVVRAELQLWLVPRTGGRVPGALIVIERADGESHTYARPITMSAIRHATAHLKALARCWGLGPRPANPGPFARVMDLEVRSGR